MNAESEITLKTDSIKVSKFLLFKIDMIVQGEPSIRPHNLRSEWPYRRNSPTVGEILLLDRGPPRHINLKTVSDFLHHIITKNRL